MALLRGGVRRFERCSCSAINSTHQTTEAGQEKPIVSERGAAQSSFCGGALRNDRSLSSTLGKWTTSHGTCILCDECIVENEGKCGWVYV